MSTNQEITRCLHPITKITNSQLRRSHEYDSPQTIEKLPAEDFLWQLTLDPCHHKDAFLHSIQIGPNTTFQNRQDISQPANLRVKLYLQDPHWELTEIIFNPTAATQVITALKNEGSPLEDHPVTASIDLSNKKRAIIDINVPARHPLTDFSMGSPILEFYIRGRHLESGKTFCTALPNVLSQS